MIIIRVNRYVQLLSTATFVCLLSILLIRAITDEDYDITSKSTTLSETIDTNIFSTAFSAILGLYAAFICTVTVFLWHPDTGPVSYMVTLANVYLTFVVALFAVAVGIVRLSERPKLHKYLAVSLTGSILLYGVMIIVRNTKVRGSSVAWPSILLGLFVTLLLLFLVTERGLFELFMFSIALFMPLPLYHKYIYRGETIM